MRAVSVVLAALLMLPLAGCTQSIYNSRRDIETLNVVQVLGIDVSDNGGVTVSAATGSDASGRDPLRLKCEGESLEVAMRDLENLAGPGSLFFSGTGAIVLGEDAAKSAPQWLDAIARSKDLRIDTELFVARGGTAAECITGEDAPRDAYAALSALSERANRYGPGSAESCAEISRALVESGAAASLAFELADGADDERICVPAGYFVLTDADKVLSLEGKAAMGAGLMLYGASMSLIDLGGGVIAELDGVGVELQPSWSDGLAELNIALDVRGSIIEAPAGSSFGSEGAWDAYAQALANEVGAWVRAAVGSSQASRLDFLGLGRKLEVRWPQKYAAVRGGLDYTFSDIDISVSSAGTLLNVREFVASPYEEAEQ